MAGTRVEVRGITAELHPIKAAGLAGYNGERTWDDPDVPYGCKSAYAVMVNGERVGVVWSKRGTSHRRSGRLIVGTSHPTEWGGTIVGFYAPRERIGRGEFRPVSEVPEGRYVYVDDRCIGDWHQARRDAIERLLRTWQELTGNA